MKIPTCKLVGLILCSCICGCAGMSKADNDRLQSYVRSTITTGMSFDVAIEQMKDAGFSCDSRGFPAPEIACKRYKNNWFLIYTCEHMVVLTPDIERRTLRAVRIMPIHCAGL